MQQRGVEMSKKLKKKIFRHKWVQGTILLLVWLYIILTGKTAKYRVEGQERVNEAKEKGKPIILAFWHGGIMVPLYYLRNQGIYALVSSHRNSAWVFHWILGKLGWHLVKGSKKQDGASSLIEMLRKLREGQDIIITPDGTSGPAKKLKPGVIYLAQKTGAYIVPLGVSAHPKKNLKTWDSFILPYFFSQAVLLYGEPFLVEKGLTEEEVREKTIQLENVLNQLQARAEQMAVTRS